MSESELHLLSDIKLLLVEILAQLELQGSEMQDQTEILRDILFAIRGPQSATLTLVAGK